MRDFITGFSFRDMADFVFDNENPSININNIKDGSIIYVKTDYLKKFFSTIFPKIKTKIKLITHNSDCSIPGVFGHYLNDDRIIHWFGQNVSIEHPKLTPIPIGIANSQWDCGNQEVFNNVIENETQKNKLIYLNFKIETNPNHRKSIWDNIKESDKITKSTGLKFVDYLNELKEHKFMICPLGNGLDCHRNWESLYLKTVPIMIEFPSARKLFKDLPVVFVDNFDCLNDEKFMIYLFLFLLDKKIYQPDSSIKWEKLSFEYWRNLIINLDSN